MGHPTSERPIDRKACTICTAYPLFLGCDAPETAEVAALLVCQLPSSLREHRPTGITWRASWNTAMNPDTSYTSLTLRLKQHKRRRDSPSPACGSFDVSQLVPERPIPDWVRHRVKGTRPGHKSTTSVPQKGDRRGEAKKLDPSANSGFMMLDLNNMRKDWKSVSTRRIESLQRARISQNRQPEPVRRFPGDVRAAATLADSPVAIFAQNSNNGKLGKKLGSPAAEHEEVEIEEGSADEGKVEGVSPLLMKNTYLTLDQSKLPLEVSYGVSSSTGNTIGQHRTLRI